MQIVEWMFPCVTSGLSTPGVRTESAAYGPCGDEPCGQTIAAPSRRMATDANVVRIDIRSKVPARPGQRKMSDSAMAQPIVLLDWATSGYDGSERSDCRTRGRAASRRPRHRCLGCVHDRALRPFLRPTTPLGVIATV